MKEPKYKIGEVVQHRASGKRGVVSDHGAVCSVHQSAYHVLGYSAECETSFDGTYYLSIDFDVTAGPIVEEFLELVR